jgi:hypothetical protein
MAAVQAKQAGICIPSKIFVACTSSRDDLENETEPEPSELVRTDFDTENTMNIS